jgi:hypothetical protein
MKSIGPGVCGGLTLPGCDISYAYGERGLRLGLRSVRGLSLDRVGATVRIGVHGVEPVRRHLDNAAVALAAVKPEIAARVPGCAGACAGPGGGVPGVHSSKQLLWSPRLLRNRAAYEERFGKEAYDAMLVNCLWGVYQMIGELNPRAYVVSR